MAAPITHIVLTQEVYKKYFSNKDEKKFYIGTSFPDIRYLGVIDRTKTHFKITSIKDLVSDDSFLAGVKFHSYVDAIRESFIISKNIYDLAPKSVYITQAIKFLEDAYLSSKVANWAIIRDYFTDALPEELAFGVNETDVVRWHDALKSYFSESVTSKNLYDFIANIGKPIEMANEVDILVSEMKNNRAILDIIEELYEKFPSLID